MEALRLFSPAEQVAERLRSEVMSGNLAEVMPGVLKLEGLLGVNRNTIEAGLRILEAEGLLVPQGTGRCRKIVLQGKQSAQRMRVAILDHEPLAQTAGYLVELQHLLVESGHAAFFTGRSQMELQMDVRRIHRLVESTAADAWVILAGSREVLQWFAEQPVPAFALFGRRRGLPIAGVGPDKPPALAEATRSLIALGHRRIVLMVRVVRRYPEPGTAERVFLGELAAHGIAPGRYHLPDWEESVTGFHARLESLFRVTPPTAMIIDEAPFFVAALQFCASRGLRVPQDVSLVCTDADPSFDWCQPSVAHIRWDSGPVVRRILRWARNVSRGRQDLRQTFTTAEFVPGGTIGPVAP